MQQSELALFAQEFRRVLEPLAADLARAKECLRAAARGGELALDAAELGATLATLAGELDELGARAERERAAVFVFGPPKSGKSTLLDALAGARVSEVSILPGYPCLQRAAHAREEASLLCTFEGKESPVGDVDALRLALQRAQLELVARVRAARARGEAFDPARHLLGAVRCVERAQPAPALERAALELVECPAVHGPLFPSYAEMLIGAPDQARAAVFVVRAAQLADESAFDGIEELLAAFERPLLVLNLDERGRELSRAGELVASLEREDPARLIAAFEELSTAAPLAEAVRAGRVPVLALDLLEVARARLHGVEVASSGPARRRARFEDLARELARVLDAHPAFHALVQGASRRARELGGEVAELAATPGLDELGRRRAAAEAERVALERERAALERLAARPRAAWEADALFEGLRTRLATRSTARAAALAAELEGPLARALEDWFADGTSLLDLIERRLAPRLDAARAELARAAERALREELKQAAAAAEPASGAAADLAAARLALGELVAPCAERVAVSGAPAELRPLDVAAIPVRPRLGQRLTWRGASEVRRALFGPPEAPDEGITSAVKARRLGDPARAALERSTRTRARAVLAEEARRVSAELDAALLEHFEAVLATRVARELERLAEPLRAHAARVAELSALAQALEALPAASARLAAGLGELSERFAQPVELVPVPRRAPSAEARPARASADAPARR
jgi:hypothetical protein